jgi:GNAT superfamily N-acetyltransferase
MIHAATSHDHSLPSAALILLGPKLPAGFILRPLLGASDQEALLAHWLALSAECLRSRFFHAPSRDFLAARARSIDFVDPRVVGIFDAAGSLVCAAQWAPEGPGVAELAFSTLAASRGQGLAKIAVGACALDARSRGFTRLRLETLRKNIAAKKLCASMGARPEPSEELFPDTIVHHIEPDAAPAGSYLRPRR